MSMSRGARMAALSGGVWSLAQQLLAGESQGLALDSTDLSAFVRDTTTPGNNFSGNVNDLLTYTSPSTKWIRGGNGLYTSGTTIRTEYNVAGAALGARIEEARTNLLLNSRTLNNASGGWTETNVTVTLNATTGIDGDTSGDRIQATAGGAASIARTFTGTAAAYTLTFRVKNDNCGWCVLSLNDGTTTFSKNFDIATGALGANGANAPTTSIIDDDGNGWYVCRITATMAVATCTATLSVTDADSASDPDAGEGLFADFAQVELGTFPTSPIVTAGSSVLRAVDSISIALASLPTISGALLLAWEGSMFAPITSGTNRFMVACGTSGNDPLLFSNNNDVTQYMQAATVEQANQQIGANVLTDINQRFRAAGSYAGNSVFGSVDGGAVVSDTTATFPTISGNLWVGTRSSGSPANGHLRQLLMLPRVAVNDAEIQAFATMA